MRCADCGHWAESFAHDIGKYGPIDVCPECRSVESAITDYEFRCRELEREGLSRSDAQAVADAEGVQDE